MNSISKITRRPTKPLWVGRVKIGGPAPISVQSMVKADPVDIKAVVNQINELEHLGCEIIRLAIPNMPAALVLSKIKKHIHIPMEADIHFNPLLALEAVRQGVDAIRLNPGNFTNPEAIAKITKECRRAGIPIRVGVNSGSVEGWFKSPLRKQINPRAKTSPVSWERMSDAALEYCHLLERLKFSRIMISLKASDVLSTIYAYRRVARLTEYPLHLGVTASGTIENATVKSSIGIGALLLEGIGDTIRVSITGTPHDEVKIAYRILQSLELRKIGYEVLACPTCGRCEIDLIRMAEQVETAVAKIPHPNRHIKVAVMGCVVNGPGEARECDIGVAGGQGFGFLFKKGRRIRKIPAAKIVPELIKEIKNLSRD